MSTFCYSSEWRVILFTLLHLSEINSYFTDSNFTAFNFQLYFNSKAYSDKSIIRQKKKLKQTQYNICKIGPWGSFQNETKIATQHFSVIIQIQLVVNKNPQVLVVVYRVYHLSLDDSTMRYTYKHINNRTIWLFQSARRRLTITELWANFKMNLLSQRLRHSLVYRI